MSLSRCTNKGILLHRGWGVKTCVGGNWKKALNRDYYCTIGICAHFFSWMVIYGGKLVFCGGLNIQVVYQHVANCPLSGSGFFFVFMRDASILHRDKREACLSQVGVEF